MKDALAPSVRLHWKSDALILAPPSARDHHMQMARFLWNEIEAMLASHGHRLLRVPSDTINTHQEPVIRALGVHPLRLSRRGPAGEGIAFAVALEWWEGHDRCVAVIHDEEFDVGHSGRSFLRALVELGESGDGTPTVHYRPVDDPGTAAQFTHALVQAITIAHWPVRSRGTPSWPPATGDGE